LFGIGATTAVSMDPHRTSQASGAAFLNSDSHGTGDGLSPRAVPKDCGATLPDVVSVIDGLKNEISRGGGSGDFGVSTCSTADEKKELCLRA
jgi:hypothetical protein